MEFFVENIKSVKSFGKICFKELNSDFLKNRNMSNIKKIAVCGAGTMGAGIAQVFAQHNFEVLLFDLNENQTKKAIEGIEKSLSVAVEKGKLKAEEKATTLSKIKTTSVLAEVKADLVIEAILEKLEAKQELFTSLAANNSPETIFATNTSSISVTRIAKGISKSKKKLPLVCHSCRNSPNSLFSILKVNHIKHEFRFIVSTKMHSLKFLITHL
jgi:threonine dehydrogenase-like Zn-dependent dehydrogenase